VSHRQMIHTKGYIMNGTTRMSEQTDPKEPCHKYRL
jgi:hypothetical protein